MGRVRFKFINNQCHMGSKQSQSILDMKDKSHCIGVSSVAVTQHESQKGIHFPRSEVSMCSPDYNFIPIQMLTKMSDALE